MLDTYIQLNLKIQLLYKSRKVTWWMFAPCPKDSRHAVSSFCSDRQARTARRSMSCMVKSKNQWLDGLLDGQKYMVVVRVLGPEGRHAISTDAAQRVLASPG